MKAVIVVSGQNKNTCKYICRKFFTNFVNNFDLSTCLNALFKPQETWYHINA